MKRYSIVNYHYKEETILVKTRRCSLDSSMHTMKNLSWGSTPSKHRRGTRLSSIVNRCQTLSLCSLPAPPSVLNASTTISSAQTSSNLWPPIKTNIAATSIWACLEKASLLAVHLKQYQWVSDQSKLKTGLTCRAHSSKININFKSKNLKTIKYLICNVR